MRYGYRLLRGVYNVLFSIAIPLVYVAKLIRSRRNPDYRKGWKERFGHVPFELSESIWVHAVSVGENIAIAPLVKRLRQKYPNCPIVVTMMTPTGRAQAMRLYQHDDHVYLCYCPYDITWFWRRFFKAIQPKLCAIVETELWPNLLANCQKHHCPVVLLNGRLSHRSARAYSWIKFIIRRMLSSFDTICAQNKSDAQRFIALGAAYDSVMVTGNIKYDIQLDDTIIQQTKMAKDAKRFTWLAASTHPGEYTVLLQAHQMILQQHPNALLVIVPRHPEQFQRVYETVSEYGLTVRRYTKGGRIETTKAQVLIGDVMGQLLHFYANCHTAFVGGSLVELGGHNVLEPAALGKPVLTGPYYFNFSKIVRHLKRAEGLYVVNNAQDITQKVCEWIKQPQQCEKVGQNAYKVIAENQGALEKQFQQVEKHL